MKHLVRHVHQELWHKHVFDYLILATGAVFFILSVRIFAGVRGIQLFLFIAYTAFYICWGIYHHIITKTLRLRVMLEYVLIGFAVIFLALTLAQ